MDHQPIQWVGSIFQNTMGNPTPNELRERARGHQPSLTSSSDVPSRRSHRQPSPNHVSLVTRLRAAGIDVVYDNDDDIPRGARIVMEDMLFHLQQKETEVAHLKRKVNYLREDSRVRKRTSSGGSDDRPAKRRERSDQSPEASTDSSLSHPPPIMSTRPVTSRHQVEARGRAPARVAVRSPLVPAASAFQPYRPLPNEDVVMRDERPRPRSPPRRTHEVQRKETPPVPTIINGREYEPAVEVTPPGPLREEPIALTDPYSASAPTTVSDDPYNFDESDHSSDEEDKPRQPDLISVGRVPDFWGVVRVHGHTGWERDNSLRGMFSQYS